MTPQGNRVINPGNEQDDRHSAAVQGDPRGEARSYGAADRGRRRRHPAGRLVPLLIFAGIVVLIARQEIPAFADWWERTFAPAEWKAKRTCSEAAIADLKDGRYARRLTGGELHETRDGPYVTGMKFTVLDDSGEERVVEYSCYLDSQGRLFRLNRRPE
jgi:hypothetical protein